MRLSRSPRRMSFARLLVVTAICFAAWPNAANAQTRRATGLENLAAQTPAQLMAGIERKHPAAYYALAKRLFEEGQREEAVFWFYAGQIRYRAYMIGNPQLPRDGDPALFASLSEVVGKPAQCLCLRRCRGSCENHRARSRLGCHQLGRLQQGGRTRAVTQRAFRDEGASPRHRRRDPLNARQERAREPHEIKPVAFVMPRAGGASSRTELGFDSGSPACAGHDSNGAPHPPCAQPSKSCD